MRRLAPLLLVFAVACGARASDGGPALDAADARTLVILGSSTAAGYGASDPSRSWAARLERAVTRRDVRDRVLNLARHSASTWLLLPLDGPPARRPLAPDAEHNVDAAIRSGAKIAVVSLPSNDSAAHVPLAVQRSNWQRIVGALRAARVDVWVLSPQPRALDDAGRDELVAMRAWQRSTFGDRFIDVWPLLAAPDGRPRPVVSVGDGIHVNDVGHAAIFRRLVGCGLLSALRER